MSVNREVGDSSTNNANWGTLVILLVVIIIGIVIAWVVVHDNSTAQPALTVINAPAAPASSPANPQVAPGPTGAPGPGRAANVDGPVDRPAAPQTAPTGAVPLGGPTGPAAPTPSGAGG